MSRITSLVFLVLVAAAPANAVVPAPAAWQDKVDASVLTQAALGETEFLIYMVDRADLSAANALKSKQEKGRYVFDTLTAHADTTQAGVLQALVAAGAEHEAFWITNTIWAKGGLSLIQALAERADVAHIYANGRGEFPIPVSVVEGTTAITAVEGNLEHVNADDVWALGVRGQGAVVGSADTGVNWEHETLKLKYRGWNAIDNTAVHDYNWFLGADPNPVVCPNDVGFNQEPCDDDIFLAGGHGTHTTSTMVGDDGGNNQVGMAPDAKWIACRNLDSGVGDVPSYLRCMEFMLAPTDTLGLNPDPSLAPDVVNNSWGCVEACPPPVLKDQLEASTAAGIFYAVSAGNDGDVCSSLAFPLAIYEASYSVGAMNHRTGVIAGFSSRGPVITDVDEEDGNPLNPRLGPDISAPGVSIRAANRGGLAANTNGYSSLSGTSMAGPHVAGLVALVISSNPDLRGNVNLIEQIISSTAVPKFTTEGCGGDTSTSRPNNTYGWGRIDALAAVQMATADTDADGVADVLDNCTLIANPSQCDTNDDGFGNHCDADLDNNGGVTQSDLGLFRNQFGMTGNDLDADLNCNGGVTQSDLGIFRDLFNKPPGPSQVANP
ncbi:hypothetical protein BH24ACT5_BH24ACT5_24830 [soil metagenome]